MGSYYYFRWLSGSDVPRHSDLSCLAVFEERQQRLLARLVVPAVVVLPRPRGEAEDGAGVHRGAAGPSRSLAGLLAPIRSLRSSLLLPSEGLFGELPTFLAGNMGAAPTMSGMTILSLLPEFLAWNSAYRTRALEGLIPK